MQFIRFFFLLFTVLLILPAKAVQTNTVSDTSVVRLMNTFQYRAAANLLGVKLKKTDRKDFDKLLYYNNQLSMSYLRLGLHDSAMICAKKSIQLSVMSTDSVLISDAWKVTSYSYNRCGKLDSALIYIKIMVGYAERNGDKRLLRNSMSSLGSIMNQNEKYKEALKYHKSACMLTKEIKDSLSYSIVNYNMGLTYLNLSKLDSSIFYLKEALRYSMKEKHYESAVYIYTTTADAYFKLGDFRKWKENMLNAYNIADKIKNNQLIAQAYNGLLVGLVKTKKYQEAIQYGNKAMDLLKVYHFPSLQIENDSSMYVANKMMGNYVDAVKYLEFFYKDKSAFLNEDQKKRLNDIQVKLEVRDKDLMIANQKIELSHKQRNLQRLLFLLALFVIITIIYIAYDIRNKRFRNKLYKKEKYIDSQLNENRQWVESFSKANLSIPTALNQSQNEEDPSQLNNEILSPQNILYNDLRKMIEKEKLYLNPELNIQMVITLLGTNKKYLYEAISSNTVNNFRNFINRYRIDYAKRLIEENIRFKIKTNLSELYIISGFNNSTTFFRTFKALTGLTPKEYATEVEIDYRNNA